MSTRTTGKRETFILSSELEGRCRHRMHKSEGTASTYDHIRAELNRLAGQVRKLRRAPLPGRVRCIDEADFITAYNTAINDVLVLLKQAKQ